MKLLCWLFSCVLSSIFCLSHSCCPVSLLALKEKALNSFFVFFQLYALRLSAIIQPVISSLRNICVHVYTEFSISQRLLNPFSLLSFSLTTTGSEKGRRTIKHSNIECNERPLKPWNEILLTCHSRPKKKPSAFICVCWHKNLKTHTLREWERERREGSWNSWFLQNRAGEESELNVLRESFSIINYLGFLTVVSGNRLSIQNWYRARAVRAGLPESFQINSNDLGSSSKLSITGIENLPHHCDVSGWWLVTISHDKWKMGSRKLSLFM